MEREYDERNNPISLTCPDGGKHAYEYDERNNRILNRNMSFPHVHRCICHHPDISIQRTHRRGGSAAPIALKTENMETNIEKNAAPSVDVPRLVRPLPMSMREQLRGRYGLEPSDGSKDAAIAELSPADMVREAVGWELGDPSWAARIAMFMRAAGAKPEDF